MNHTAVLRWKRTDFQRERKGVTYDSRLNKLKEEPWRADRKSSFLSLLTNCTEHCGLDTGSMFSSGMSFSIQLFVGFLHFTLSWEKSKTQTEVQIMWVFHLLCVKMECYLLHTTHTIAIFARN